MHGCPQQRGVPQRTPGILTPQASEKDRMTGNHIQGQLSRFSMASAEVPQVAAEQLTLSVQKNEKPSDKMCVLAPCTKASRAASIEMHSAKPEVKTGQTAVHRRRKPQRL